MSKAITPGGASWEPGTGATEEFQSYLEYNKVLRSWLVAFGVGGPALFLINADVAKRLADKQEIRYVATLFLVGAGCQVAGAMINKISNWYVYWGAANAAFVTTSLYSASKWVVQQFWIDITLDAVTITAFGLATWTLLTVFSQVS